MNNATIQSHDIFSLCDKGFPPRIFNVFLEFRPEWSVIVKPGITIVNLGGRKDESASFAQTNNVVHRNVVIVLKGRRRRRT